MADTPIQHGTEVQIGLGDLTFTGLINQSGTRELIGDVEKHKGEDNETANVMISDRGVSGTVEGLVLAGQRSALEAIQKGDTASIDDETVRIDNITLTASGGALRVRIQFEKEDSISYT